MAHVYQSGGVVVLDAVAKKNRSSTGIFLSYRDALASGTREASTSIYLSHLNAPAKGIQYNYIVPSRVLTFFETETSSLSV